MTMYTANGFLDSVNQNLTQLSTSCSPAVIPVDPAFASANNQQLPSGSGMRQGQISANPMMSSSAADDHNALPSYQVTTD